jgi:hypothetical protein
MSWLPEDVKEASGGEVIDRTARDAIRLAHRALDRFPDLVRKHKVIAGGAAISSSLVVLAGVAITRRVLKGQSAEDAVRTVTEAELQGIVSPEERRQSSRRPTNGAVRPSTPEERHLAPGAHIARRHVSPSGPAGPTSGDPSHR